MSLRCGVALRDLTPSYPVYLHGYADRDRPSEGVAEPISLGCLALDDGTRQLLIVTGDLIGIESQVCESLYALLARETGIAYPFLLLSCSHTHFAPALHPDLFASPRLGLVMPDPRFVEDFEVKIVEVARESLRKLQPVRLETARICVPQVLFNRRTRRPDGSVQTNFRYPLEAQNYTFSPTDPELAVLRFRDERGIRAALVNFGCHPVTGGQVAERDHYRISADYPFYLRRTIADSWHCPVLFTLGAAGDAVPIDRFGDCRQRIGQTLGHAAVLAERVFAAEEEPQLAADFLEVEVRTILTVDPCVAPAEYEKVRQRYAELQADPATDRQSQEYRQAAEAHAQKQIAFHRSRLYPENRHRIRVQFLRLGRLVLVCLPFEVLAEFSLRLKERFPQSLLVSCAGGYQGYLPLRHEYARGGYEASPWSTHFEEGTADRLLELVLERLAGEK